MNENQRTIVALLTMLVVLLVWGGSVVGSLVYASQPGNGGAVILAMFAALVGYGFFQEARESLAQWA